MGPSNDNSSHHHGHKDQGQGQAGNQRKGARRSSMHAVPALTLVRVLSDIPSRTRAWKGPSPFTQEGPFYHVPS